MRTTPTPTTASSPCPTAASPPPCGGTGLHRRAVFGPDHGHRPGALGRAVRGPWALTWRPVKRCTWRRGRHPGRGPELFPLLGMHISGQTGDADAMAYRAGAVLSGKEFPDMHMNIARHPMWKGNGEMYPAYFQFDDALGRRIPNKGFDLSIVSAVHAGFGPIYWDFDKCTENDLRSIDQYLKKRNNPRRPSGWASTPPGGKYPMIGGAPPGLPGAVRRALAGGSGLRLHHSRPVQRRGLLRHLDGGVSSRARPRGCLRRGSPANGRAGPRRVPPRAHRPRSRRRTLGLRGADDRLCPAQERV